MYKQINWIANRNPLVQNGDGYQLQLSAIVPTPCTPFAFKQAGSRNIRPGQAFKVTYALRNILTSTLTEANVAFKIPAGYTLLQTYPPKQYTHERPVVENGEVWVKLNQVPARGTAKITLLFRAPTNAASGTVSFPFTAHIPTNYCYQQGAATVRV